MYEHSEHACNIDFDLMLLTSEATSGKQKWSTFYKEILQVPCTFTWHMSLNGVHLAGWECYREILHIQTSA